MLLFVLAGTISVDASVPPKNPLSLPSEITYCSRRMDWNPYLGCYQSPRLRKSSAHPEYAQRKRFELVMVELA